MSLGEVWLEEPHWGWWTRDDFPAEMVIDGRLFKKARFRQPYDGVVEQFREAVPRNSMHLFVRADGTWVIDHVDEDNPDMGRPLEHFFNDHPAGKMMKRVAGLAAVSLLAVVVVSSLKPT